MKTKEFDLSKQLDRVHEWIKSADQKISITFAVENGVIIALSVPLIATISSHLSLITIPIIFILTTEVVSLFLIAGVYAIFALLPNIKPRSLDSIIYFGSIKNRTYTEYGTQIKSNTVRMFNNDMLNQISISSEIAFKKHNYLKASLYYFMTAIVMTILFYIIFAIYLSSSL